MVLIYFINTTDPADIVGSRPTAAKSNIRRHPATTKLG